MNEIIQNEDAIGRFKNIVYGLSRSINGVGVILLLAIMFLLVAEVILRRFFNRPFTGTFELVQFMLVTIVYLGTAYTATKKWPIAVVMVVSKQ